MQTDEPTESATATDRRTFLTRSALGGALVTVGVLASPVGGFVLPAGAQDDEKTGLDLATDAGFATFAAPLEWAAVQAYQNAIQTGLLDQEWIDLARLFQSHHQDVVDTLTPLAAEGTEPTPDSVLLGSVSTAIEAATDTEAVLTALSDLEDSLSATHLLAVGLLTDGVTAKIAAQVLTVEAQQAALLAVGGGGSIAEATPPVATTDDALRPGEGAEEFAAEAEAEASGEEAEPGEPPTGEGSGGDTSSGAGSSSGDSADTEGTTDAGN